MEGVVEAVVAAAVVEVEVGGRGWSAGEDEAPCGVAAAGGGGSQVG